MAKELKLGLQMGYWGAQPPADLIGATHDKGPVDVGGARGRVELGLRLCRSGAGQHAPRERGRLRVVGIGDAGSFAGLIRARN